MNQILLIQNDPEEASKMLGMLHRCNPEGVEAIHAKTIEDGISRIRGNDFDLIFADIDFPGIDPIKMLNTILDIERKSPVIILSAKDDEEMALELIDRGIQDYLLKWDFNKRQLYKTIKFAIHRKRWEESLRISEERLKMIFESAPLGFFLIDMNGTIIDGNRATEKILGYYKSELKGKSYFDMDLIPSEERDKAIQVLVRNSIGMSTGPDLFVFRKKSGENVKVELFTNSIQINSEIYALGIVKELYDRNIN